MSNLIPKDQVLDAIVRRGGNVAQHVSYGADGSQRYLRIRGVDPEHRFATVQEAVQAILDTGAPYVNIRSFLDDKPDGNPFFMGRKGYETPVKAAAKARELMAQGYKVIINEEIDVMDGGLSGVVFGDVAEFAACDTPRCVEHADCATMPRLLLGKLVRAVYGHHLRIPYRRDFRVEFSVHPGPVGYFRKPEVVWQAERMAEDMMPSEPELFWPNRYSTVMGDKAFGLVMADLHGLPVPRTKVYGRVIPFFEFGEATGSEEVPWVRTCPREQQPGQFTTKHGWLDPYAVMQREDPECVDAACSERRTKEAPCYAPLHRRIASIIVQDNVDTGSGYSGACITGADGRPIVEGTPGQGDAFMVGGVAASDELPGYVVKAVTRLWEDASVKLSGPVRFEWVFDDRTPPWIVQFHRGQSASEGDVIVPGDAAAWEPFMASWGLEKFREFAARAKREGTGVVLRGAGVTSHFGDILRREAIPSRRERA